MWPDRIDLDVGEMVRVPTRGGSRSLRLAAVEHSYQPDFSIADNPARRTLAQARVTVEVDGEQAHLILRPYQLPEVVNGLRLYVETTRPWAEECAIARLEAHKAVRLSVLDAGEAWGPEGLVFPVRDYRWRAASYNNTWSALVPYNLLYYHRGEDFGAIPDELVVQAVTGGEVIRSPLPVMQGSNVLQILSPGGLCVTYAHMNLEHIDPRLVVGAWVQAGDALGRTGCTWDGRRSQTHDPHLHVDFAWGPGREAAAFSPYAFLLGAYFNSYLDEAAAAAGGYQFAGTGQEVRLDASRSQARPGSRIVRWEWHLSDGRVVEGPLARMVYEQPGLYSEELRVWTQSGEQDRDFAQVRVYAGESEANLAHGWVYASPARGARAGQLVRFWNRLLNAPDPVWIDYGDGSAPERMASEARHVFNEAGWYTVKVWCAGACVKVKTRIE